VQMPRTLQLMHLLQESAVQTKVWFRFFAPPCPNCYLWTCLHYSGSSCRDGKDVITLSPRSLMIVERMPGNTAGLFELIPWGNTYRINCDHKTFQTSFLATIPVLWKPWLKFTRLKVEEEWSTCVSTTPGCIQFDVTGIPKDTQRLESSCEKRQFASFDCPYASHLW
jgi:hypothetical protein